MRIAVSTKATTFHKGFGGLETQNKALCEGLARLGHEVVVFSPKLELIETEKVENGVIYAFVACSKPKFSILTSWSKNSWNNRLLESFTAEDAKSRFDVFISQSSSGLAIIAKKRDFNIPALSVVHGSKLGEFQTRLNSITSPIDFLKVLIDLPHILLNFFTVQRQFIHGSDLIIAVSSAVKRSLVEETFVDERKIKVIHNGIATDIVPENLQKETEDFFEENKIKLLYVGQIAREKGMDYLLNILKDSRFENFQLIAVGGGSYLGALKEKIKLAGLAKKFILKGKLDYSKVVDYYVFSQPDIFVFPTKRIEGFPMVLVEAMLASLPIVAFGLGGVSDAVINGETGFVVQQGNLEGFKKRLLELAGNQTLRQKLGENAKIKALHEFSLENMVNEYTQVLDLVIKEHTKE